MNNSEFGKCDICKKDGYLQRTYYRYHLYCECHSPNHFELIRHCKDCAPVEPLKTTVTLKTVNLKKINLSYVKRKLARREFVIKYRNTFHRMFKKEIDYDGYLTEDGKIIVKKARMELNYKNNTASCDIFNSLTWMYKSLFN